MEWIEFTAAGVVFLASHRVPTIPGVRQRFVRVLGERAFLAGYSLLSVMVLWWLVQAAGRAPYVELWGQEAWQSWIPVLAMPLVCLLGAFSIGVPNPLSIGGRQNCRFDAAHPGVVGVARHGLLWATAIWSASHIVPNGNLAHVTLFGSFALFSLYGMRVIDTRKQNAFGLARWNQLSNATSFWPLGAIFAGRWTPNLSSIDRSTVARLAIAVVVYTAIVLSHEILIGVSALPATALSDLLN